MALFSTVGANNITARIPQYDAAFKSAASKYGVAVELLYALASHESSVIATAVGPTKDYGLMQVTESTYRRFVGNPNADPMDLIRNPALCIDVGAHVISDNILQTHGDVLWAISAYNRGFSNTYAGHTLINGRLPDGVFPNQSYVDDVKKWVAYYRQRAGLPTEVTAENIQEAGPGSGTVGAVAILAILGAIVAALLMRGK